MQDDGDARTGDLPSGFGSGETAANDVNGFCCAHAPGCSAGPGAMKGPNKNPLAEGVPAGFVSGERDVNSVLRSLGALLGDEADFAACDAEVVQVAIR